MPAEAGLHVEVAFSPGPDALDCVALVVAPGCTAAQAVGASGLLARHGVGLEGLSLAVWSRPAAPEQLLREGDRVEVLRPLKVDPKEARRLRYKRQRGKPPAP